MEAKTQPQASRAWPAVRAMLLLAGLLAACDGAQAQGNLLTVRPLRDAGGLPLRLNVRLTSALERFLTDHAGDAFTVVHAASAGSTNSAAGGRYLLDGDVSFASGRREDAGRFLMTARLFRAGAHPVLIGQWTGVSSSLRTLTANLHQEHDLNRFGLVGELGSRILAAVTDDTAALGNWFSRIESQMHPAPGERPDILSATGPPVSLRSIKTDAAFCLRFRSAPADRTYRLLIASATGELRLAPLAATTPDLSVPHGHSLTSAAIHLPDDTIDAWIVWRGTVTPPANSRSTLRHIGSPYGSPNGSPGHRPGNTESDRFQAMTGRANPALNPPQPGMLCLVPTGDVGAADTPTVQVLDGVGAGRAEPDPEMERFLTEISREPARWHICRIPIVTDRN